MTKMLGVSIEFLSLKITAQSFGDLGLRMERAIAKHNFSPVLLVGSVSLEYVPLILRMELGHSEEMISFLAQH